MPHPINRFCGANLWDVPGLMLFDIFRVREAGRDDKVGGSTLVVAPEAQQLHEHQAPSADHDRGE